MIALILKKGFFASSFAHKKDLSKLKKVQNIQLTVNAIILYFCWSRQHFFKQRLAITWETYLDVVTVSSVTIFSIRQSFVIRHFCSWVHFLVGSIAHCPSPVKWRHITEGRYDEPAVRLYQLEHSIGSMRYCLLELPTTLPLNEGVYK